MNRYRLHTFWLWTLANCNIFDAFITHNVLSKNIGTELNPIMAALYDYSSTVFLGVKIAFSILVMVVFDELGHERMVRIATAILGLFYLVLVVYEIVMLVCLRGLAQ